jgi:hypothetical protein
VADRVIRLFRQANANRAPGSINEWERVARRFLCDLHVVCVSCRQRGVVMDEVIVVRRAACEQETVRRIAHELAEYLLSSEWEPPYCCPCMDTARERHHIARLVEGRL